MQRVIRSAFVDKMHTSHAARYAWFITMLGLCGDMDVISILEPPRHIHPRNFIKVLHDVTNLIQNGRVSAIKDFNAVINHGLDDRLDSMSLTELLQAGEARVGNTPSDFILNPNIASQADWGRCMELVKRGVISQETLNSILNLMGTLIKEEAQHKADWVESGKVEYLTQAADAHLRLNDVCFTTIMQFIRRNVELDKTAAERGVRLEDLSRIYPRSIHVARVVQIQDDFSDIILDIVNELESARAGKDKILPAANIFVARLCERLQPPPTRIEDFHARLKGMLGTLTTKTTISYDELPQDIRDAIEDVHSREFKTAYESLPPAARTLAEMAWQSTKEQGFATAVNRFQSR